VEFKNEIAHSKLPPIWRSWINHQRHSVPTEVEEQHEFRKQIHFQRKVKEIEQADEKLRLQELADKETGEFDGESMNEWRYQSIHFVTMIALTRCFLQFRFDDSNVGEHSRSTIDGIERSNRFCRHSDTQQEPQRQH
jgi:hypothetical protein